MIKIVLWTEWLKDKFGQERGAGLAEYALLLFVVAVAATTVIAAFGQDIVAAFSDATESLPSETTVPDGG